MSYTPNTWAPGDKITSVKLNALEQAVGAAPAGTGVTAIIVLTQAAYDVLAVKDPTTLYVISG